MQARIASHCLDTDSMSLAGLVGRPGWHSVCFHGDMYDDLLPWSMQHHADRHQLQVPQQFGNCLLPSVITLPAVYQKHAQMHVTNWICHAICCNASMVCKTDKAGLAASNTFMQWTLVWAPAAKKLYMVSPANRFRSAMFNPKAHLQQHVQQW